MTKVICNQCGKEITLQQKKNAEYYALTIPLHDEQKMMTIDFHRLCLDKALVNLMKDFKVLPEKEDMPLYDCPECRAARGEFDDEDYEDYK